MSVGVYLKSVLSKNMLGGVQYDTIYVKFESIQDSILIKSKVMLGSDKQSNQDGHFLCGGRRVESDKVRRPSLLLNVFFRNKI